MRAARRMPLSPVSTIGRLGPGQALEVRLRWAPGDEQPVGRMAWRERRAFIEFDDAFLAEGLPLSPFRLPLGGGVIASPPSPFEGLHGVFNDSLPDGWGRLLQDRRAISAGFPPSLLTPLDRLSWVGASGIGALAYRPELLDSVKTEGVPDLDHLATASMEILSGAADDVLVELLRLGGSPHGARPKVLVSLRPKDHHVVSGIAGVDVEPEYRPVLVKFRASTDPDDSGALEFAYHRLARDAGVEVPEAWLLPSRHGAGWFAVSRFDVEAGKRWHVHSLCGLLHADHRIPSLDYVGALAAVHRLTGDYRQVIQMYRRMVLNIVAHNQDDHTKQVSLRMDRRGCWTLAPAYDLTFAEGPGGEHSMAVAGEGRPGRADMLRVADQCGIPLREANPIIEEITEVVQSRLARYASEAGVRRHGISQVMQRVLGECK